MKDIAAKLIAAFAAATWPLRIAMIVVGLIAISIAWTIFVAALKLLAMVAALALVVAALALAVVTVRAAHANTGS